MRNDSSLTYNTPQSKIQNFKDFEADIRKEKDNLKQISRGYKNNKDGASNLANVEDKTKYNKLTHKTDSNFGKEIISDFINNLDDEVEDSKHKYKLEKTQDKAKMESYQEFIQKKMIEQPTPTDYSDDTHVTSYMFFGNLETIHRLCQEILKMDEGKINQLLIDGHNWAEDHVTTAKVQVTQVYNFLTGHKNTHNENHGHNYMFFANLQTVTRQCEEILSMNESEIDELLVSEHDWAEDHISSAKENVEQVHEFLQNELI